MALGWAIYGTWNWWTWWLHEILEHEMSLYIFLNTNNSNNTNVFLHTWTRDFFEHEIRRRPTDRREVITRITRIFFFAHGTHFFCTRISRISRIFVRGGALTLEHEIFLNTNFTRILFGTRLSFFKHTDLTHGFRAFGSLWMTARYGYWLVVVIDLLCFKWQIKKDIREPCEALADPWDLWDPCAK